MKMNLIYKKMKVILRHKNILWENHQKQKEKHVNIKDITANDGKVTLEGRILTSEVRETRSGKGMLIFDLYDGTGTITIKSFAKRPKRRTRND